MKPHFLIAVGAVAIVAGAVSRGAVHTVDVAGDAIIHPFFSAASAAPAFYVECRNDTGSEVSTADSRWPLIPNQLRIDEVQLKLTGGSIGPGLSSTIEPGGTWNGIIELRQSATGGSPAVRFGAHVRSGHPIPLTEGRHTIAVKCGDRWSQPHVFYWEKQH